MHTGSYVINMLLQLLYITQHRTIEAREGADEVESLSKRCVLFITHVASVYDAMCTFWGQSEIEFVGIRVHLWQHIIRKTIDFLITICQHFFRHVWKDFVSLLNDRYYLRQLLLGPVDDTVCELNEWSQVTFHGSANFKVYLESWVLLFKWMEVVKEALLSESRIAALVFCNYRDFILRRSWHMRPNIQWRIQTMHDIVWLDAIKASEIV